MSAFDFGMEKNGFVGTDAVCEENNDYSITFYEGKSKLSEFAKILMTSDMVPNSVGFRTALRHGMRYQLASGNLENYVVDLKRLHIDPDDEEDPEAAREQLKNYEPSVTGQNKLVHLALSVSPEAKASGNAAIPPITILCSAFGKKEGRLTVEGPFTAEGSGKKFQWALIGEPNGKKRIICGWLTADDTTGEIAFEETDEGDLLCKPCLPYFKKGKHEKGNPEIFGIGLFADEETAIAEYASAVNETSKVEIKPKK